MSRKIYETNSRFVVRNGRFSNESYEFVDHIKEIPDTRANLAIAMVEKWGAVAAKPDGEDSSGRSKLALLTPTEVVTRAVETADLIVSEIEKRGWMDKMPNIEELYATEEGATN